MTSDKAIELRKETTMRNPTGLSPRAFYIRRLRQLFQQRPPRVEPEQEPDADAASPPRGQAA